MEITVHTKDLLVIEDKNKLAIVFIIAIAGAGLLLTLASMKEYGVQAWYRMTHWLGVLMVVGGGLVFTRFNFSLKLELSLLHQKGTISRLRGFSWELVASFTPSDISELKIEKQKVGHREGFRLLANINNEWIPLQKSSSYDYMEVEQAAKALQLMLG